MLCELSVVLSVLLIFSGESLVGCVKGVDLSDIFDHDGSDGGEFFF